MTLYQAGASPQSTPRRPARTGRTTPYGRWRLAAESEAMKRFPGFSLHLPEGGNLTWAGVLRSTFNRRKRYLVKVTYPDRFPHEAPVVTIEKPALDREDAPPSGRQPSLSVPRPERPAQRVRPGADHGGDAGRLDGALDPRLRDLEGHRHLAGKRGMR